MRFAGQTALAAAGLAAPAGIVEWQATFAGAAAGMPPIVGIARLVLAAAAARRAATLRGDKQ